VCYGIVDAITYEKWWKEQNKKGAIYPHSGDIAGPGIQKVSNEEMEKRLIGAFWKPGGKDRFYTRIGWEVKYEDCMKHFLDRCKLLERYDPSHIRFVFGFDS
jgi:hypothetical protein